MSPLLGKIQIRCKTQTCIYQIMGRKWKRGY
nr:MAG TPA: hypothetical protein [Caudoviricetes sp.]